MQQLRKYKMTFIYIYIYTQSSSHSKSGVTNFNLLDGQLFYCGVQFWTQVDSSVGQTRATGRQLMIRILSHLICIRKNRNMYELWIFRVKCLRCKYSIIWQAIVNIFTLSFSLQSLLFSWQHVQTVRLFWVLFVDIFCDWEDKKKKKLEQKLSRPGFICSDVRLKVTKCFMSLCDIWCSKCRNCQTHQRSGPSGFHKSNKGAFMHQLCACNNKLGRGGGAAMRENKHIAPISLLPSTTQSIIFQFLNVNAKWMMSITAVSQVRHSRGL